MHSNINSFKPNWVSLPGDTINDYLKANEISINEFATRINKEVCYVQDLVSGKEEINESAADLLSTHLGASKEFWIKRQAIYVERKLALEEEFIYSLPTKHMIMLGWINNISNLKKECYDFFGVSNFLEWKSTYSNILSQTAFRKSSSLNTNPLSVISWIRQGENKSNSIICKDWNPTLLKSKIPELRQLVKIKSPQNFIPRLKQICSDCGVAVVILRTPPGCPASGATKFIDPNKAMILLSFRFLTDDQFWFTFFHEIGHLLLHSDRSIFVESDNNNSIEEVEANSFSQDVLIPKEFQNIFHNMNPTQQNIKDFAKKIDMSLGVVVGQLQHLKKLNVRYLNGFKRQYDINDIMSVSP